MNKSTKYSIWFIISITLNALGNSFMIISNLGSAPWTSAAENLVHIFPLSIGTCIIMLYVFALLFTKMLEKNVTMKQIGQSMLLAFMFGILIDVLLYMHQNLFIPEQIVSRYIYLFIGLILIAIATTIYFQSSLVYLPSDFLLKAFGNRMKNYTVATIVWTAIPLSIGLIISIYRQQLTGIGPGTLLFMFGNGFLIDLFSRWIVIRRSVETT